MSTIEKNELKRHAYTEALRYIENAKEALQKAGKDGKYYKDVKYVRSASGIAYSGMLLALDALMKLKDINLPSKQKKSIEWYRDHLRKLDLKILNDVNHAYNVLHLLSYYEGDNNVQTINTGLQSALSVIRRIKPSLN